MFHSFDFLKYWFFFLGLLAQHWLSYCSKGGNCEYQCNNIQQSSYLAIFLMCIFLANIAVVNSFVGHILLLCSMLSTGVKTIFVALLLESRTFPMLKR